MQVFLATLLLCLCSSEQIQPLLPKEAGGENIVGPRPTCVSAGRILHMLLSAQWYPGLLFAFLITLKFSHMVPLPSQTSAQWQLVLETNRASKAFKLCPHSLRKGLPKPRKGLCTYVCMHACLWVHICAWFHVCISWFQTMICMHMYVDIDIYVCRNGDVLISNTVDITSPSLHKFPISDFWLCCKRKVLKWVFMYCIILYTHAQNHVCL
jgi:hypothetical protein